MVKIKPQLKSGKNRVSLNWTQLNVVIEGHSAIDVGALSIRNRSEAVRFAHEYGFDLDNPIQRDQIVRTHAEAVAFIKEFFLSEEEAELIPLEVLQPENILDLLVYSSNYLNKSNQRQMWACAVLKVMHGIFHFDHDIKLKHFDAIRAQIFDSLDKVIISKGAHHMLSDGKIHIPLFFYEKKRTKGRKSILLKLLQKPTYVASDIYDHLGIRLVFETKLECLFALTVLRRNHLISVTNVKPFRTRNNLIDFKAAKKLFNHYRSRLERSTEYPYKLLREVEAELENSYFKQSRQNNPHSSQEFRNIQVTARKMIRLPNPSYLQMQRLLEFVMGSDMNLPGHFAAEAEIDKELAFYFDYEIQLVDRKSYVQAMQGPASHEAYKARQIETARRRVLGPELIRTLADSAVRPGAGVARV